MSDVPVTGPREAWPDERAMARVEGSGECFDLLRAERDSRAATLPERACYHRQPPR